MRDGSELPDEPVKLARGADLGKLSLTPSQGFVLSRVDGKLTVSVICSTTGLGKAETMTILQQLQELGVVIVGDGPPPAPGSSEPAAEARAAPVESRSADARPDETDPAYRTGVDGMASEAILEAVEAEEKTGELELPRVKRLRIRALHAQLGELTFFELLGVAPEADLKTIRRAYFKRSKQFHPDRYFTKKLGPYKVLLEEIFNNIAAAWNFLQDETKRTQYRDSVLQQREQLELSAELEQYVSDTLRVALTDEEPPQSAPAPQPDPSPQSDDEPSRVPPSPESEQRRRSLRAARLRAGLRSATGVSAAVGGPAGRAGADAPGATKPAHAEPRRAERDGGDRAAVAEAARAMRRRSIGHTLVGDQRDRARQHFEEGMKKLAAGDALDAAASLKMAVTLDPADAELKRFYERADLAARELLAKGHAERARLEEQAGRHEVAARLYLKALEQTVTPPLLRGAAETLANCGQLRRAREHAQDALARERSLESHVTMARVLLAAGDRRGARRSLAEAQKIERAHPSVKALQKQLRRF